MKQAEKAPHCSPSVTSPFRHVPHHPRKPSPMPYQPQISCPQLRALVSATLLNANSRRRVHASPASKHTLAAPSLRSNCPRLHLSPNRSLRMKKNCRPSLLSRHQYLWRRPPHDVALGTVKHLSDLETHWLTPSTRYLPLNSLLVARGRKGRRNAL